MADEGPEDRRERALRRGDRAGDRQGEEIAQFFGTSSPTTMRTTVDSAVPITSASEEDTPGDSPVASTGPRISLEMEGSESMPTIRLVTVIPS